LNDKDVVLGPRGRRPVVVGLANVHAHVQATVRAERDAVEAGEVLRPGVDRALLGEVNAVPFAPGQQAGAARDVQRLVVESEAEHHRRSAEPHRHAVPEHEHATGALVASLPASPSNTLPAPKANDVGVPTPVATSCTFSPLAAFGPPDDAAVATAASAAVAVMGAPTETVPSLTVPF
jgi:hypothetical protein